MIKAKKWAAYAIHDSKKSNRKYDNKQREDHSNGSIGLWLDHCYHYLIYGVKVRNKSAHE